MHFRKFVPLITALFVFFSLELFLTLFPWYMLLIGLAFIITLAGVWHIIVDRLLSKNFLFYSITPVFFLLTMFAFLALTENSTAQQATIIIGSFLYWLYMENVYLFNFNYERYNEKSIENVSSYINLVTFFLFGVSLYASYTLIGAPFWALVIALLVVTSGITLQSFWAAGLGSFRVYMYLLVINVLVLEFFWGLALLPTDFYVHGFLLTVVFYVCWGISKSNLHQILNKKIISRYVFISMVTALLVVITTSWY